MRRSPVLLALVLAACSHQAGTSGLGSPTPLPPTSPATSAAAVRTPSPLRTVARTPGATSTPAGRRTGSATASPAPRRTSGPTPARTASPGPTPTRAAKTWLLTISGFAFSPDTPSIHVGDSIRVTNDDPDPHTLTAKNGSFDSGQLAQHRTATLRFTTAGVFDFVCTNHASMTGQLTVSA